MNYFIPVVSTKYPSVPTENDFFLLRFDDRMISIVFVCCVFWSYYFSNRKLRSRWQCKVTLNSHWMLQIKQQDWQAWIIYGKILFFLSLWQVTSLTVFFQFQQKSPSLIKTKVPKAFLSQLYVLFLPWSSLKGGTILYSVSFVNWRLWKICFSNLPM